MYFQYKTTRSFVHLDFLESFAISHAFYSPKRSVQRIAAAYLRQALIKERITHTLKLFAGNMAQQTGQKLSPHTTRPPNHRQQRVCHLRSSTPPPHPTPSLSLSIYIHIYISIIWYTYYSDSLSILYNLGFGFIGVLYSFNYSNKSILPF